MSSETTGEDLIDFEIGSPEIPTSAISAALSTEDSDSDNLLDSELHTLIQQLQTLKQNVPQNTCATRSVDVEDILISIYDVSPERLHEFHNIPKGDDPSLTSARENTQSTSLSEDHLEALSVLKQLDEVLNESLVELSHCEAGEVEESVEDCLVDLDNYLQAFDTGDVSSKDCDDWGHPESCHEAPNGPTTFEQQHEINADAPAKEIIISNFEENYRRFLEIPPSLPTKHTQLRRNHTLRSISDGCTLHPNQRLARLWTSTRSRPPDFILDAMGKNPLGTASPKEPENSNQMAFDAVLDSSTGVTTSAEPTEDSVPWLRNSMRRLRHFRLPNDLTPNAEDEVPQQRGIDVSQSVRSFSAPSTLSETGGGTFGPGSLSARNGGAGAGAGGDVQGVRARSSSASSNSRPHRSLSSSDSSFASSIDSLPSCVPNVSVADHTAVQEITMSGDTIGTMRARRSCDRSRSNDIPEVDSPLGTWPHGLSSMLACLGCTLGLFNICRFAILSTHFGANFIFQFLLLSVLVGLPLFTLQLCLGQQLGSGVIDMWRVSPLFQGVGVALLISQALTGMYTITGVSWMFVYFRDSFITKLDRYRWAEPFTYYRKEIHFPMNGSYKLSETIPDYLSGIVFQRTHLVSGNVYGTIKFQPAFNLAMVWMIVFVSLSKGLRSYGKVVYVFTLVPVFSTFILCAKLLGLMSSDHMNVIFPETVWNEFFVNPKSWLAACQEVFLTWGLMGAAAMQIASHNKNKHLLQRDSSLVAVVTICILLLMAFLANTCLQILDSYGYSYHPDSFENISSYTFLRNSRDPYPTGKSSMPVKYMIHNSFIVGERVLQPGVDANVESGYQVLRFATELIPATFAILGSEQISPFWAVIFYFVLILFGIAQQLAIWHCVITGIIAIRVKVLKSWETTITFFSCACGFVLGLPMTTELGIYVVYFLDVTVGGSWWLILVILLQIVAVFMVRGRPYSGDTVVTALFNTSGYSCVLSWAPVLLSFTWNVVLPVVLTVFCVAFFKNGNFKEMFVWHHAPSAEYWPLWARQIGSMIQILPLLMIPIIAIIQSYRYLNKGPTDILERIQLLYRPPLGEHMADVTVQESITTTSNSSTTTTTNGPPEDPPPKYTPPPSYTTATGARLAKFLRQSIRRSIRRIATALGEASSSPQQGTSTGVENPPPPDYNTIVVEMNGQQPVENERRGRRSPRNEGEMTTFQRELRAITSSSNGLTVADVASILRNSFRRSTVRPARRTNETTPSLSVENLVDSAAPIGETSLVPMHLSTEDTSNDDNNKSACNLTSVI